jgi:hypothetical protein
MTGVAVGFGVAVGVATGVAVGFGVGVMAGVAVGITVGLGVGVAVAMGRGVGVGAELAKVDWEASGGATWKPELLQFWKAISKGAMIPTRNIKRAWRRVTDILSPRSVTSYVSLYFDSVQGQILLTAGGISF